MDDTKKANVSRSQTPVPHVAGPSGSRAEVKGLGPSKDSKIEGARKMMEKWQGKMEALSNSGQSETYLEGVAQRVPQAFSDSMLASVDFQEFPEAVTCLDEGGSGPHFDPANHADRYHPVSTSLLRAFRAEMEHRQYANASGLVTAALDSHIKFVGAETMDHALLLLMSAEVETAQGNSAAAIKLAIEARQIISLSVNEGDNAIRLIDTNLDRLRQAQGIDFEIPHAIEAIAAAIQVGIP